MRDADPFIQSVGQEFLVHLTRAGFTVTEYTLSEQSLTLSVGDCSDLADLSNLEPTLHLWFEQRGANITHISSATRISPGNFRLTLTIEPITDLPATPVDEGEGTVG